MRQRAPKLLLALGLLVGLAAVGCGDGGGGGKDVTPKANTGNAPPLKRMKPAGVPKPG